MVLYTFGHYFAAVYNQDIKAWVIYDDNFVASKKSVVKGTHFTLSISKLYLMDKEQRDNNYKRFTLIKLSNTNTIHSMNFKKVISIS